MANCEKLTGCMFVKHCESDQSLKLALNGLIKSYCQGDKQGNCIRKKVGKELGGPACVPTNMMPGGTPLPKTDDSEWPDTVMALCGRKRK